MMSALTAVMFIVIQNVEQVHDQLFACHARGLELCCNGLHRPPRRRPCAADTLNSSAHQQEDAWCGTCSKGQGMSENEDGSS